MQGEERETLLKDYPDVFVLPSALRKATTAARRSGKSGYSLVYHLLVAVCSKEEIAYSRGQGLTKPKAGDFRLPLQRSKIEAIKGNYK